MKTNFTVFLAFAILFVFSNGFAQHSLQVDDGNQHYSTFIGPNPGGTYVLPPGGGTLVTTTSPGSIPIGGIIMWSGSIASIPAGWGLCDGLVHSGQPTPDLRNRFIVGAGSTYAVGNAAGSTNPVYSASGTIGTSSNATGISINSSGTGISVQSAGSGITLGSFGPYSFVSSFSLTGGSCSCGTTTTTTNNVFTNQYINDGGHFHGINDPGHSHSVNDLGHSHTVNVAGISITTPSNLPPYYALAYIMRVQ